MKFRIDRRKLAASISGLWIPFFPSLPAPSHVAPQAVSPAVKNSRIHLLPMPGHGNEAPPAVPENLHYMGGPVMTAPKIYLVWWGRQWADGFDTIGEGPQFDSAGIQQYNRLFYAGIGGTHWQQIPGQYCEGTVPFSDECVAAPPAISMVGTQPNQLAGDWTDPVDVPGRFDDSAVQAEAIRADAHFGHPAGALYVLFSPSHHSATGFGGENGFCAYHGEVAPSSPVGAAIIYAYMPYLPDVGCGAGFVNRGDQDDFGHGIFDGFSIAGGHEYAEAITDPYVSQEPVGATVAGETTGALGWYDLLGAGEIGDMCAWIPPGSDGGAANIYLSTGYFAVQSLWSNIGSHCAI